MEAGVNPFLVGKEIDEHAMHENAMTTAHFNT